MPVFRPREALLSVNASGGEARSEKILLKQQL
jgi:hypothetical protein